MKNNHSLRSPAIWCFFATLAVRLFVLARLSTSSSFIPVSGDTKFYSEWAQRIAHGQLTTGHAFYGLPGYPFLLAGLYRIFRFDVFSVSFAAGILQAVNDSLTSMLIWKIAQKVFSDAEPQSPALSFQKWKITPATLIGAGAVTGWIFFQPAQTFSVILMPTSWLIMVFWFCVYRLLDTTQSTLWRPWLWLGLLIGLMTTMVATILFLIPLAAASIFCAFEEELGQLRWIKRSGALVIFVAAIFAGASPCWLHNYFVAHEPVLLSAHSGLNLYIGNNPIANGYPKIPPGMRAGQAGMLADSITMAEAGAGHSLKYFEVSQYWSKKAHDYISQHPAEWGRLMLTKFANFWNTYQYDDLSLITRFAIDDILTPGIRFGLVAVLALPGMLFALIRQRKARWILAAVLLHMAALMPVFVTERYRLAAVPGLLLFMWYGLWDLWNSLCRSHWKRLGANVLLCGVSALFVTRPQTDPSLWSLDYYNTGIKAIEADNLDLAQKNLELAYRYVPDNSEINFALGNLWFKREDKTRAKQFYRRAIEINSRHSSAYNNLAVLAIEEERWSLAGKFLKSSLAIEPNDAKPHYLLARVELQLGDLSAAQREITEALRLRPHQGDFEKLAEELSSKRKEMLK